MCGRYSLHAAPAVVALQFGLAVPPSFGPRYNISPGTDVVAVRATGEGSREACALRWGLIPAWAKDSSIGNRLNNARGETVAEKPSFRAALRRRRCILPASGFYEWKVIAGRKQPYYIHPADDHLFGFAALWENWEGPQGAIASCAVITTAPNSVMSEIHDRMPVILDPNDYSRWLAAEDTASPDLLALLRPCDPGKIAAHPVSTRVNRVKDDDAGLMQALETPVEEPRSQGSLF